MFRRLLLLLLVIGFAFSQVNINNCTAQVNLNQSNTVYALVADLNYTVATAGTACLWINATNVTLDCQNHIITGTQAGLVGAVFVDAEEYASIVNCRFANFSRPFTAYYSNHTFLKSNIAYNTTGFAAFFFNGDFNTTADNNFAYNNTQYGFGFWNDSNATVTNNSATLSTLAAFAFFSNWSSIYDNHAYFNTVGYYFFLGGNNEMSGNLDEYSGAGLYVAGSHNNTFTGNNITNPLPSLYGVWLNQSFGNYFAYNRITSINYSDITPLILLDSDYNTFFSNNISVGKDGLVGVYLLRSHRNNMSSNRVSLVPSASAVAVVLAFQSHNNTLLSNTMYTSPNAAIPNVWIAGSSDNNVSNNDAYYGSMCFDIEDSINNFFFKNYAHNCSDSGFYVYNSNYSTFIYNEAYNNTLNGFLISVNTGTNFFEGNLAYNNSGQGFRLSSSLYQVLTSNRAFNNSQYGFELSKGADSHNLSGNIAHNNTLHGFYVSSDYNNLINNTATDNVQYGFLFSGNGNSSNIINNTASKNLDTGIYLNGYHLANLRGNLAFGNYVDGFHLLSSENNTLIGNNASGNTQNGFVVASSKNNSFTDSIAFANGQYGVYLAQTALSNLFTNTLVYNQTHFIFQAPTAAQSNNFTNLTLGYNTSIGLVNFQFLNVTSLFLNNTDFLVNPDWVSMNDSIATQANKSANITIFTGTCDFYVKKKAGFPTSLADILANGTGYSTTIYSCAGAAAPYTARFDVSSFSGYAANAITCVNLSDPNTWGTHVVNNSGTLYVNRNTTLCRDHYYVPAPGFGQAALQMNSSNIFLDCNESILDGTGGGNFGLQVSNVQNDTIGNCTLTNYDIAFSAGAGTTNILFINNTAHNNTAVGFRLQGANRIYLVNDVAYNNSNGFVFMGASENSSVDGCSAYNNSFDGFYSIYSLYCLVTNSAFYENLNAGLHLDYSNYTNITNTRSYSNLLYGIQASNSSNDLFDNVTLNGNYDGFEGYMVSYSVFTNSNIHDNSHNGFYTEYSTKVNVTGSSAVNNTNYGIGFRYSNYSYAADNYANGSLIAFGIVYSNLSTLDSNNATNSSGGFVLIGSGQNVFTNSRAYSNSLYGIYLLNGANQNNFTNTELYNNLGDAAGINGSNSNVFTATTIRGNSGRGLYVVDASGNNFTDMVAYNNSGYGIHVQYISVPTANTFTNTFIYNQSNYLVATNPGYQSNFTNLTLGYTNAIGLVNYPSLILTGVDLYTDESNLALSTIILRDYWVSLNDVLADEANKTANITIYTDDCSYYVLRRTGFPTSLAEILMFGTIFAPNATTCTGAGAPYTATFNVSGFSGYAINDYTACLNLSDPATWAGRIVNSSGILYINKNTTLCPGYYQMDVAAATPLLQFNYSNIWLNCSGATIDGVDVEGYGIYIYQTENNTIKDCNVLNYEYGFYASGSPRGARFDNDTAYSCDDGFYSLSSDWMSFTGCTAHDNTATTWSTGFVLSSSDNNIIQDCYSYGNANSGFYLGSSDYNVLTRNNATNNSPGFRNGGFVLSYSDYNNLTYNRAWDNPSGTNFAFYNSNSNNLINNTGTGSQYGLYIAFAPADGNTVMNNTFMHASSYGISFAYATNTLVADNLIYNSSIGTGLSYANGTIFERNLIYESGNSGISIWYTWYATLSNNTVHDNAWGGIVLQFSQYNNLTNNTAYGNSGWNTGGFDLQMSSHHNTLRENRAYGNTQGFHLTNDHNETLINNTAYSNNQYGIYLESTGDNVLVNNTAHSNTAEGMMLYGSYSNEINDTVIHDNGGYGLWVSFPAAAPQGSLFTNTLIYDQADYVYLSTGGYNNDFVHLILGYNATVGLIDFFSMNADGVDLTSPGSIILMPDWVSLDGASETQADVPANVTINNSNCAGLGVLGATGFPTTLATILTTGTHYPTEKVCNGDLATFNVSGFSGYTLGQEQTYLTLNFDPSSPMTYGTPLNISCAASNPEVLLEIFQNGTSIAGPTAGYVEYVNIIAAGYYNFTCNTTGNENYTAAEESGLYQIDRADPTVAFDADPGWTIRPGQEVNVSCFTTNPEITLELWIDGGLIGTGSYIEDVWTPATTGSYEYTCNSTETENYTAYISTTTLNVRRPSDGGEGTECYLTLLYSEDVPAGMPMQIGVQRDDGTMLYNAEVVVIRNRDGATTTLHTNVAGYATFTPEEAGLYTVAAEFGSLGACEPTDGTFNAYPVQELEIRYEQSCDGNLVTVFTEVCEELEPLEEGTGAMGCMEMPVPGVEAEAYFCPTGDYCPELIDTYTTDSAGQFRIYAFDGNARIYIPATEQYASLEEYVQLIPSVLCPTPTEEININFDPACEGSTVTVTGTVCEEVTIMQDMEPTTVTFYECAEDRPLPGMPVRIYCCPDEFERTDRAIEDLCTDLVDSGTTDSAGMFVTNARDCTAAIFVERMLDTHMEDTYLMVDLPTSEECAECVSDSDCQEDYVCRDGTCVPVEVPPERRCQSDDQCTYGTRCSEGICTEILRCAADQDCPTGQGCLEGVCYTEEEIEQIREGEEGVEGEKPQSILDSIFGIIISSSWLIVLLLMLLLLWWFFFWKRRKKKREEEEEEIE